MMVICKVDGPAMTFNGFHDNGIYEVVGMEGNCHIVINDNGHTRAVLLDCPSPHIKTNESKYFGGYCCGHFEKWEY